MAIFHCLGDSRLPADSASCRTEAPRGRAVPLPGAVSRTGVTVPPCRAGGRSAVTWHGHGLGAPLFHGPGAAEDAPDTVIPAHGRKMRLPISCTCPCHSHRASWRCRALLGRSHHPIAQRQGLLTASPFLRPRVPSPSTPRPVGQHRDTAAPSPLWAPCGVAAPKARPPTP